MRAHQDEEIIKFASAVEKNPEEVKDKRIAIAVGMDDEHGTTHTYVVSFCKNAEHEWQASEVSELSSL
jgi:hypothetical protein